MNATYYLKILICRTSTAGADAQAMTFNLAHFRAVMHASGTNMQIHACVAFQPISYLDA